MLNGPPLAIITPSLDQLLFTGGPPLVLPNRVKFGGSVKNEDKEERETRLVVMDPTEIIVNMIFKHEQCMCGVTREI